MTIARVSKKGWVVIPKKIREAHGIRPGDRVVFVDYDGVISLIKAADDPIKAMRGMFEGGPSLTEELIRDRREQREKEEREIQEDAARAKTRRKRPVAASTARS